ncbi:MAG: hypothetical protein AAGA56_02870, partial [Myxococcota bacterium]
MRVSTVALLFALSAGALGAGCEGQDDPPASSPQTATAVLDLSAGTSAENFYDLPFPSDLRLEDGRPVLTGFPNAEANPLVAGLMEIGADRNGWSTIQAAHFRFDGPLAELAPSDVLPADPSAPVWLIDVDPDSPARGTLFPTTAATIPTDAYTPDHLLGLAAAPGIVLVAGRRYAYVVTSGVLTADGLPTEPAPALEQLRTGGAEADAVELYAPLWETLEQTGLDANRVVNATVFRVGDVVADTAALTDRVREAVDVTIDDLGVDPDDGADHERFCE